MTARELVELLRTNDPDKPVIVVDENDKPLTIAGIDSYEDAIVLVTEG